MSGRDFDVSDRCTYVGHNPTHSALVAAKVLTDGLPPSMPCECGLVVWVPMLATDPRREPEAPS